VYYYYVTMADQTIRFERNATEEEYNRLNPHISKISKILIDKRRIDIVVSAYSKLVEEFDNLSSERKSPHDSNELIFSLTYYLAAFKKYLDNWETDLKRTFGKQSEEVKLFKAAQSHEYDSHMEYRIFYRLRNYDQHCGNLVSHITSKVLPDNSRQHLVLADRDRLLSDFDEWKPEEVAYLKSCEQKFEIRPLIDVFQSCIISIHEKIMQIHFNKEFYCSCATLIAAAKEFENEDEAYFVGFETEIDWANLDLEGKTLHLTYLEVPICKKLLELYFLNNQEFIKILYHGSNLKKRIGKYAYEIDSPKMSKVAFSQPPFVNLCGQNMIRLYSEADILQNETYCILADSRFPKDQRKDILETWKFLLESIT